MSKEMILEVTDDCIMSHSLRDGLPDADMVSLMGSHSIPTPYIGSGQLAHAVNRLQQLNPDVIVRAI